MLALAVLVALAFAVEATVGFGSTVLVVTIGAQWVPLGELLPAFVPVSLVLSGVLVARARRTVPWRWLLVRVLPPVGLGLGLGVGLFREPAGPGFPLALGALVMTLAAVELRALGRREPGDGEPVARRPLGRVAGALVLALGGVVHGVFGSGGPLIVYALGREVPERGARRTALAALWVALNGVLVVNYAGLGRLTVTTMERSVLLLPAMGLGLWVGDRLHGGLPERTFRWLTYGVLLLAGASLTLRTLAMLWR